ncbi:hypothetical protein BB561_001936 [Smittium simulii]|uniref:Uncharacterized protein n=1 Tax=Smittium simulii TaxID=133385 RepID=A0A2T9YSA2_9FUNG|nr:hypothetical protein BB561_001936 [Smittium simulii]
MLTIDTAFRSQVSLKSEKRLKDPELLLITLQKNLESGGPELSKGVIMRIHAFSDLESVQDLS